jgi:hypothetical protein
MDQTMDAALLLFKQRIEQCRDLNKLRTYSYRVQRLLEKYQFLHDIKRQKLNFWEPLLTPESGSSHLRRWINQRAPSVRLFRTNMSNQVTSRAEMTLHDRADRAAHVAELQRATDSALQRTTAMPVLHGQAQTMWRASSAAQQGYRTNLPTFTQFDMLRQQQRR